MKYPALRKISSPSAAIQDVGNTNIKLVSNLPPYPVEMRFKQYPAVATNDNPNILA